MHTNGEECRFFWCCRSPLQRVVPVHHNWCWSSRKCIFQILVNSCFRPRLCHLCIRCMSTCSPPVFCACSVYIHLFVLSSSWFHNSLVVLLCSYFLLEIFLKCDMRKCYRGHKSRRLPCWFCAYLLINTHFRPRTIRWPL